MRISVVLGQWLDRPLAADLEIALLADELGYPELWVPEMAKADAPALATLIAARTEQIELTLGPLPVTVRSSVQIAIALQTVSLVGRNVHVALGTSSSLVARWHGRSRKEAAARLDATRREDPPVRLSVLDQSPIREGGTAAQALSASAPRS